MENQNNTSPPADAHNENGANVAQEVSSTTQPVEPTKRSLRVETWKNFDEKKCGVRFSAVFNSNPVFLNSNKAATLLSETDEFKNAQNIKVNMDRSLHAVKIQTLLASKNLYLPATRTSSALFLKVDVPENATEDQMKEVLRNQDVQQHRTAINFDDKVELDLVVIGSVVVSRDGYRIGRGNGFDDLGIGLLIECGAITPKTTIVTIVHDVQVADNLPTNLFQKYDAPVDLIVTPTDVIRVNKRLPRPAGIFWELLSERRLKIVPSLQALKDIQVNVGKEITLKDEDTDIEQNHSNTNRRRTFRRRFGRKNPRNAYLTDTEQQAGDNQQKRNAHNPRNRRFFNRRRRPTKSEGDQSGAEGKSQDRKGERIDRGDRTDRGDRGDRKQKQHKNRPTRDFCIKLSNISREVRVKDLKTELRKRECNPLYIAWKGYRGKCYLHFGNRNGAPSTEEDMNKVLNSLNELSLTVQTDSNIGNGADGDAVQADNSPSTKVINVNVKLIKFEDKKVGSADGDDVSGETGATRIESVDTTTV